MVPYPGTEIQIAVGDQRVAAVPESFGGRLGRRQHLLPHDRKKTTETDGANLPGLKPLVHHPLKQGLKRDRGDLFIGYPF